MRAADLFEGDVIPAEVARRVGVTHQVISEWRKAWRHVRLPAVEASKALAMAGPRDGAGAGTHVRLLDAVHMMLRWNRW